MLCARVKVRRAKRVTRSRVRSAIMARELLSVFDAIGKDSCGFSGKRDDSLEYAHLFKELNP